MAGALLTTVCLWALSQEPSTFDRIIALQRAGDLVEAYEVADGEADDRTRFQAQLFVRHHGGDLAGALSAGRAGLEVYPDDPWLLERSTAIALELGAGELASDLVTRLASLELPDWQDRAVQLEEQIERRLEVTRAADAALVRARLIVGSVAVSVLGVLGALRWGSRQNRAHEH